METGHEVMVYPVWQNQGNEARKAYSIRCFAKKVEDAEASNTIYNAGIYYCMLLSNIRCLTVTT